MLMMKLRGVKKALFCMYDRQVQDNLIVKFTTNMLRVAGHIKRYSDREVSVWAQAQQLVRNSNSPK